MSKNINLTLPDGAIIELVSPDAGTVTTTLSDAKSIAINTAVLQASTGDKHFSKAFSNLAWSPTGGSEYVQTIVHNLNKYASVSVIDNYENVLVVNVEYIDTNTVKLYTRSLFSGKAYFN